MNREGKTRKGLQIYVLCAAAGVLLILLLLTVTAVLLSNGYISVSAAKTMSTCGALLGAGTAGRITARLYPGKLAVRGACTGGLLLAFVLIICASETADADFAAITRLALTVVAGTCVGSMLLSYKTERKKKRKRNK